MELHGPLPLVLEDLLRGVAVELTVTCSIANLILLALLNLILTAPHRMSHGWVLDTFRSVVCWCFHLFLLYVDLLFKKLGNLRVLH